MILLLLQSDFSLFIGHFHPLVVHLPIGFLLLAGVFFFIGKNRKYEYLNKALPLTLGLSALSSVVAIVFGLLLANSGNYGGDSLFWHKWLGISVGVIAVLAWLWSLNIIGGGKSIPSWLVAILVGLLFFTGHHGGNLTHGEGYLLGYAPDFVQNMFGSETTKEINYSNYPDSPDSTMLFSHLIQQSLDQKCVSCHNQETQRGDLNLTNLEAILKGGDGGAVLVKGDALESELFHRVTMNTNSVKFMPPKGVPLAYQEVRLLEYWIEQGHSAELAISDEDIPEDIKAIIEQYYKASTKKIPYVERVKMEAVSPEVMTNIEAAGFSINPLAANNNFVDVSFRGVITKEKLQALTAVKDQLTLLNLSDTNLQDDWLAVLSQFPNLTRLRLERNQVSNEGIAHLKKLSNLESLNLYGTQVNDEGLVALEEMTNLQKLFLWQTAVTKEGVAALQSKLPGVEIDLGMELADKGE